MPELPEVETIVQQLKKKVLGKKIVKIEILDKKVVDPKIKDVLPIKITAVKRRAKSIIIELEKVFLLVHLRMTGHFHYAKDGKKIEEFAKFMVAKFYLNDKSVLTHNSIRKFGSIKLLNKTQLDQELSKLGPEPLDKKFTLEKFAEILLKKKSSNIKTLLMDQNFLAGVGNIYASEILYSAKVNPNRKVNTLTQTEIRKIYSSLRNILESAVKHHGTTVENYVHIEGSGGYQNLLQVYHKQKCPLKHQLKSQNIGGRNTFYCPQCQK